MGRVQICEGICRSAAAGRTLDHCPEAVSRTYEQCAQSCDEVHVPNMSEDPQQAGNILYWARQTTKGRKFSGIVVDVVLLFPSEIQDFVYLLLLASFHCLLH